MIRLTLFSRAACHLCDEMRREVDVLLADRPHEWNVVDVDNDPDLARRYGDSVPVLFVNGHLFAKIRLPRLSSKFRLLRVATPSVSL
ncbi:MAG TPA: glutaredoxin family protein [Thermoanaerobaculia bacterium]